MKRREVLSTLVMALGAVPFIGSLVQAKARYEVACMVWVADAPNQLVGYGHFNTEEEALAFIRAKHKEWAEQWREVYEPLYVQPDDYPEGSRKCHSLAENSLLAINEGGESGFNAAVREI